MNFDYQIFFINDMNVNEVVTENEDGSFTIFVNSNLCESKRLKAIKHAFQHIMNRDFEQSNVQEIESYAHDMV
ncbi:hypothetical protein [Mediterraneibacter agrestimuris]|uniref:hypothetical protein n=1 Tax=Mediterraneibacter agrestimuris TaxID=2941333 RepID=UPI00203B9D35|nr:hypothetical protein [Mediterraneibacter agrestimuris]